MDSESDEEYRGGDDKAMGEREWRKLRQHRMTNGYKEGYSAGQEAALQTGFDEGYKHSVQMAFQLAKMRGNLCAYLCQEEKSATESTNPVTAEVQDLVEKLSALEETLAKARTASVFEETSHETQGKAGENSEALLEQDSSEGKDGENSEALLKQDSSRCKTSESACSGDACSGASSCKERENEDTKCSEGLQCVQDQMKSLVTAYDEVVSKWNKT